MRGRSFKLKLLLLLVSSVSLADIGFHRLESLPTELNHKVQEPNWSMRGLGKLDFSDLKLNEVSQGLFRLELPGERELFQGGMPSVPFKSQSIEIPKGYRVELALSEIVAVESDGAVPMKQIPVPHSWNGENAFRFQSTSRYFPGELVRSARQGDKLFLNFFPAQVNVETGRVVFIKSASVWVNYLPEDQRSVVKDLRYPPSLIVTSEKLKDSALALKELHRESGLRSQIVLVEEIEKSIEPIDEKELPDGYKNEKDKDKNVIPWDPQTKQGYNYGLARKIIRFLRDRRDKTKDLKYVTLLGDGTIVPPSYYFTLPATVSKKWGVTDQCYSSGDLCLRPDLAVGRLPFSTNEEGLRYVAKAKKHLQTQNDVSSEIALMGGKGFPNTDVYTGELAVMEPIDSISTNWAQTKKYFRTKQNYTKDTFLSLVRGEMRSRFVYAIDHGTGNKWYIENNYITSKEVLETKAAKDAVTPIVVSISCTNAAFDEETTKEAVLVGQHNGTVSVGVALLKAEAGAVAYWGSARPGIGDPIYDFDSKGNLKFKGTNLGLQLHAKFFEKYSALSEGRLGDVVRASQSAYVAENANDMKAEPNAWTYYIATLLGDPTLPLPKRAAPEVNRPLALSDTEFGKTMVSYPSVDLLTPVVLPIRYSVPTTVNATLVHWIQNQFGQFQGEEVVTPTNSAPGLLEVKMEPVQANGVYFLRLENGEGVPRERQVWFNVFETNF